MFVSFKINYPYNFRKIGQFMMKSIILRINGKRHKINFTFLFVLFPNYVTLSHEPSILSNSTYMDARYI